MNKIATISRVLLGLMFTIFGLNGFLNFITVPPPTGVAGQFMGALFVSHYLAPVFALQLVAGLLLLSNRLVPLALTILGPLLVNIALYHVLMAPYGYGAAVMAVVLWSVLLVREWAAFAALFAWKTGYAAAQRSGSHGRRRSKESASEPLTQGS